MIKVDEPMDLRDWLEASLVSGDDTRCGLLHPLLHDALALSEERIRQTFSIIAQRLPAKPTGLVTVLTGAKTIGLSRK